ncbi:MAG: fibronectin type III domain-containing protein, partial [Elusimicrobia bacterium]|nr:fibronectin type III domain-containing protein [Elusimicrobiota bacterium]
MPAHAQVPSTPTSFNHVALGTNSIRWTWTDNSSNESGFRVLSGTNNFSGDLAANATNWTQSGLSVNTLYGPYSVQAFNSSGTATSGTDSGYTLANVPTGLASSSVGSSSATLSWSANGNPGTTIWTLQRSTNGASYSTIYNSSSALNFTDTGLSASTTYWYQVRAQNGESIATAFTGAVTLQTAGPPIAPTSFVGSALDSNRIQWTWTDNSSNESGFRVMNGGQNVSGDLAANTNSWVQTGLSANASTGPFFARAFNAYGTADSGTDSRYTLANVPTGLGSSNVNASSATVSWSANGNSAATIYDLQRSTNGASFSSVYTSSLAVTYTDTALSNNSTYYYKVKAQNGDAIATAFTSTITVVTGAIQTAPIAATGFSRVSVTSSSILWTWTDNSANESGFRVMSGTINVSGDLAANTTTWNQTGLAVNASYGPYFVRAFNGAGTSDSGTASFYTGVTSPVSITATPFISSVTVTWSANGNPGGTRYNVYRSTSNPPLPPNIATGTATSYTDPGLAAGTTYFYIIESQNGDATVFVGASVVSAQTGVTAPAAPSGLTRLNLTPNSIQWNWADNSNNETGFRVMSGTISLSGDLAANTTLWTQTGLSPNTEYGPYFVRAFNAAGTSDSGTATKWTASV